MLDVLHESGGVLAVAKPAGLSTQAPPGLPSVEAAVRARCFGAVADSAARRRHPGGFLGIPHRLDRAVSGVLLLATTPRAARVLSRQFERRQIEKRYVAVLEPAVGTVAPASGTPLRWCDVVRKVHDQPRVEIVAAGAPDGREAITDASILGTADGRVAVALLPLTGRMHQLRAQAAARRMPVAGDEIYGARPWPGLDGGDTRTRPIALHAAAIEFTDPESGERVCVSCPVPRAWHEAYPAAAALVAEAWGATSDG